VTSRQCVSAAEVASWVGGVLHGPDRTFTTVASLEAAGADALAFATGAVNGDGGVVLARYPVTGRTIVVVEDPKLAFIEVLERMFPERASGRIDPRAHVDPSLRCGDRVTVHAGAVVMEGCELGDDTVVFPNAVLYPGTLVGRRCRIHAGAVLGSDGFGYHPTVGGLRKVPHVGRVRVGDDVEIGAASTVDRAVVGETVIGPGSKLDDQVHVAHNCVLGRGVIIAAQTGISGSVTIGDGAMIGGQVGVTEGVAIGAGARIGAKSGVHKDVPSGETWLGIPAMPIAVTRRVWAALRHLPTLWRRSREP
jgi:UDP-3-O-[3-hydroxymyristoyl] glucosamine N-acyltransferase